MQTPVRPPIYKTKSGRLAIAAALFLFICLCCFFASILSPDAPVDVKATAEAQSWQAVTETALAVPTETALPTATELPTITPSPTTAPEIQTQQAAQAYQAEKQTYQPMDYRELVTYPNSHIGEKIVVTGTIFNINSDMELQMYVGPAFDAVYVVMREPYTGIYKDDTITVYAMIFGENCGTNSFGGTVCQPLLIDGFFEK